MNYADAHPAWHPDQVDDVLEEVGIAVTQIAIVEEVEYAVDDALNAASRSEGSPGDVIKSADLTLTLTKLSEYTITTATNTPIVMASDSW